MKIKKRTTIATPAKIAQSPRPSSNFNSFFNGGFGLPFGSAGFGAAGLALGASEE